MRPTLQITAKFRGICKFLKIGKKIVYEIHLCWKIIKKKEKNILKNVYIWQKNIPTFFLEMKEKWAIPLCNIVIHCK